MSDSLRPHEPQHSRPPCPSPTPGVHPNHVHWVDNAIQPSHPLLSPSPPALNLSQHQGLVSNESVLRIRWPKYWSFSFNISPSNEHPELISFRMDWLDVLAVQGTLKSVFQHHSSKASILWRSAFFIVQLSHPYMNSLKKLWTSPCYSQSWSALSWWFRDVMMNTVTLFLIVRVAVDGAIISYTKWSYACSFVKLLFLLFTYQPPTSSTHSRR